jgi:hypothetical protein
MRSRLQFPICRLPTAKLPHWRNCGKNERLDAKEARKLQLLAECLRRLGWAPGD